MFWNCQNKSMIIIVFFFLQEEKEIDYGISNSSYWYLRNQCRDMAYIIERWSVWVPRFPNTRGMLSRPRICGQRLFQTSHWGTQEDRMRFQRSCHFPKCQHRCARISPPTGLRSTLNSAQNLS